MKKMYLCSYIKITMKIKLCVSLLLAMLIISCGFQFALLRYAAVCLG